MILKNKVFVAIAFCCTTSASIAMDNLNQTMRAISLKTVVNFAEACSPESIITGAHIKEWGECENQVEEIGGISYICPQIFLCDFLDGKFVIKAVRERAIDEISSAKNIYNFLSTKRRSNAVDIVSCTFYAIFRRGQLLKAKHVKDYQEGEIHQSDWVLEFMPRAPGISLEKLIVPTSEVFNKCTSDMFKTIGEAIHYLNFELNIIHDDLHCGNIIVDPDTMKVSFIDFDNYIERTAEDQSDVIFLFFTTFYDNFICPIMRGEFQTTENDEKILHFMHLLLSSSLEGGRRVNLGHIHRLFFGNMYDFVMAYRDSTDQANIPNGILDQKINTLCTYLKRFIVFFYSKDSKFYVRVGSKRVQRYLYDVKAIQLFFDIWTDPDLNNLEAIREVEKNLEIPEIGWHTSMLSE
jgi:serine/threonine protein kinase